MRAASPGAALLFFRLDRHPTVPRTAVPPAVHKFGGAALADAAAIRDAARIVAGRHAAGPVVVVASAMRGVTDALLGLVDAADTGRARREAAIAELRRRHADAAAALAADAETAAALARVIDGAFDELAAAHRRSGEARDLAPLAADAVLAIGERLTGRLLAAALAREGVAAEYVDATAIIHAGGRPGNASPDLARTEPAARKRLAPLLRRGVVPVVPGFIAAGPTGAVVTLGRGGSDLTATLLGRVLRAREVTLWKDVPGMLTADPRVVPDARLIPVLHAREASELAYYGAKVLHPRALIALGQHTRLRIRPFADPEAEGTLISAGRAGTRAANGTARYPVKALAVIADQALVTIAGNGMAGVPGIAARAFGALHHLGVSVSLISQASSEHSICLGIPGADADAAAASLEQAFAGEIRLEEIDGVEVRPHVATIAVVGLGMAGTRGVAGRLFTALADAGVNIVAIAQGASELNISVVVDGADAATAQRAVHAAFRLDKIGGGSAERPAHADVVLLGFGQIGREVAAQLGAAGPARSVRVVAAIDRTGYLFDPDGLSPRRLAALAAGKRSGVPLGDAPGGVRASPTEALATIASHALSRPILVDVTAGDTGPVLEAAIAHGMDLVLANKRPLADGAAARAVTGAAAARGRRLLHEATVGAGLPIIDTINKLVDAGDPVLRIEGCPSGTLGYLFGELGRGVPFSVALRSAMKLGYTEPDPRDDLSGADVARKALILGRLIGFTGELADVGVESLVPAPLRELPLPEFLARLESLDAPWARRVSQAHGRGAVLRYRATVTPRRVRVGVVTVEATSPLGALTGTDNQFAFTTTRYRANPLVITGAGAGAAVTAAGVLNDVLKLAGSR